MVDYIYCGRLEYVLNKLLDNVDELRRFINEYSSMTYSDSKLNKYEVMDILEKLDNLEEDIKHQLYEHSSKIHR